MQGYDTNADGQVIGWRPRAPPRAALTDPDPARCQHPDWCDTAFQDGDADAVQRALWAHQHPADCATSRLLVLTTEYLSGLGSSVHVHTGMLALAVSDNGVLVLDPDMAWEYAPAQLCACARVGAPCVGASVTSMDCLFLPASNCSAPPNWAAAHNFTLGSRNRVQQARSVHQLFGVDECRNSVQAQRGDIARFADRSASWWQAQLTKYVLRPRVATLRDIVAPAQAVAFWATGGAVPHPIAAVFMRSGASTRKRSCDRWPHTLTSWRASRARTT